MPTPESLADCTSPTRLPAAPMAPGFLALKYSNGSVAAPVRRGWGPKLLARWAAATDKALGTPGRAAWAPSAWAQQLSYRLKPPTKAKTLGMSDSVIDLF